MGKLIAACSKLLAENDKVSIQDLIVFFNNSTVTFFFDLANLTKTTEIKSLNKPGFYRRPQSVLNKFEDFAVANLNINRKGYKLLKEFEPYMVQNLANTQDTLSILVIILPAKKYKK
jgi:hypothetical protein